METTLEIRDPLFRKVKSLAAERGHSLKDFVTDALRDKLAANAGRAAVNGPEFMQGFGKLKRLHNETIHVQSVVDREFEVIEAEDRR